MSIVLVSVSFTEENNPVAGVRWGDSFVLWPFTPMVVLVRRASFLLVAFETFAGRKGRIRLHRNCVFVVEKLNWFDVTLATVSRCVQFSIIRLGQLVQFSFRDSCSRRCAVSFY